MPPQQRPNAVFAAVVSLSLASSFLFAQEAVRVSTARVDEIAIYPQKNAPATVHSLNEAAISTEIAARIQAIFVRVGEVVKRDALLARLDCTDYLLIRDEARARLASLAARIALAERRLQRTEQLTMTQTVAEELLDERQSDLAVLAAEQRAARAALEMAKADIARCDVTSPFHAVITERVSAEGEFAGRGTPVVRLIDIDALEIAAQVPIPDTEQLTTVAALFFEDSARRYPLALRTVVPAVNTTTRNREVRLVFEDTPALPGAAGKLTWQDNRPHIPGKLLVRRGDDLGVFIYDNGKARFHVLDHAQQGRATVVNLPLDSRVITEGQYSLQDGQAIRVMP